MSNNDLKKISENLEKELDNKNIFDKIDMTGISKTEIREKSREVEELEKDINDLEEELLPEQNLKSWETLQEWPENKPEHELEEASKTASLPQEGVSEDFELKEEERRVAVDQEMESSLEWYEKEKQRKKEEIKQKKFEKQKNRLGRRWYFRIIKRPVIYLAGIEILIHFFSLIPIIKLVLLNIVLPLISILDILVFGWLSLKVIRKDNQKCWIAIKVCFFTGVMVGFLRALFKLIWINQIWAIVNLLIEPMVLGGIGVVVSIAIGIFIKKRQEYNIKNN